MPDYVPPGAPPAGVMAVDPDLLDLFALRVDAESRRVGAVSVRDPFATVESSVPGADLINGCIGVSQTVEPLVKDLYDSLSQLYLDIRAGIAGIRQAEADNAARLGQAGGR